MTDLKHREKGARVGAISHTDDDTLYLFGYGEYLGRRRPSECEHKPGGLMGKALVQGDIKNPLIRLDDGNHIWGCECWWNDEEEVKKLEKTFEKLMLVDIEIQREKARVMMAEGEG